MLRPDSQPLLYLFINYSKYLWLEEVLFHRRLYAMVWDKYEILQSPSLKSYYTNAVVIRFIIAVAMVAFGLNCGRFTGFIETKVASER